MAGMIPKWQETASCEPDEKREKRPRAAKSALISMRATTNNDLRNIFYLSTAALSR
jgi:hypothetical protein